jgi:hypothetical protein
MLFRELGASVLAPRLVHGLRAPAPDVALQTAYALANLANGTPAQQDALLAAPGPLVTPTLQGISDVIEKVSRSGPDSPWA